MIEIEFEYNQTKTVLQGNLQDKFQDIINKYIQASSLNSESLKFFSNDIQINQEDIIESQMSQINKGGNKIKVLVELILNKMTILYKIDKDKEKIKLFGDNFVNNNKNNCCLLIEGKRTELCTELILNEKQK